VSAAAVPVYVARAAPSGSLTPSLTREVWVIAWPAITHMVLISLVFIVDRLMLGRFSSVALASLQLSSPLAFGVYAVLSGFATGTLAVVARSVGASKRRAAAEAAGVSIVTAFGLGVVVAVPLCAFRGALLTTLFPAVDPEVLQAAETYLGIVLAVLPLALVEATAAAALHGVGDTRTPLFAALVGNSINVALSAVLVFGLLGMPRLGVPGAALGTAAAMAVQAVLLVRAQNQRHGLLSQLRGAPLDFSACSAALRKVMQVGLPAFGERLVYQGGYIGFVAIIGLLGPTAMAANQVLWSIEAVCFLSADGFGVAAAALVGQKLGARRADEALRAGWVATGMAVAGLSCLGTVFALAPRVLVCVFTSDAAIVDMSVESLYVAALAQPFMAAATVLGMSLRGAGATRTVLLVSMASVLTARIGATWLFAIEWSWGLEGVWWASALDWALRAALLGAAFARGGFRRASGAGT